MSIVFVKGKRFESVKFSSESEFESLIVDHANEIFWSWINTGRFIFIDKKKILKSKAGVGTIPDGYLLWLDTNKSYSSFNFVEFELSGHPVYEHIIPQIIRFKNSLTHHKTRETLMDFFHNKVNNLIKNRKFKQTYIGMDAHKLINNLLDERVGIVIVIDRVKDEFKENFDEIAKHVDYFYVFEISVLINTQSKRKTSPKTKVFGLYPDPDDPEFPEWYSATIRKKLGNGYLVDWTDGDKTNTKISRAVSFHDHIILVNEIRVKE